MWNKLSEGITSLFFIALFALVAWGWVLNIIAIAHTEHVTGMTIIRAIGIFLFPLGAIFGWFF